MLDLTQAPRSQRHLMGHGEAWDHITTQFKSKRFHSAWILSGPQGIGKATFAYQVARFILADQGPNPENKDFFHSLIDQNAHPNLLVIERGTDEDGNQVQDIKMEDVQRIREFVQQSPAFPGWRVILIDGLEYLNRNAANAILKNLEEPPHKTVFLCVCHHLKHLLPTIRSRCSLLPLSSFKDQNQDQLKTLWPDLTPFEYAFTEGRIGKLAQLKNNATPLSTHFQTLYNFMKEALQGRVSDVIAFSSTLKKHDSQVPLLLDLLSWMVRRIVLLSAGIQEDLPQDPPLKQIAYTVFPESGTSYWLTVQQKLDTFLHLSQGAHLDQGHLLEACFIMIHHPEYYPEL